MILKALETGEQTPLPKNPLTYFWCHDQDGTPSASTKRLLELCG